MSLVLDDEEGGRERGVNRRSLKLPYEQRKAYEL